MSAQTQQTVMASPRAAGASRSRVESDRFAARLLTAIALFSVAAGAINIAAALARRGVRTLLVDIDPQGSVRFGLGLRSEGGGIADYLAGTKQLPEIVRATSLPYLREIGNPLVSKGSGLVFVTERLGLERAGVVAFGDGENDVELLGAAGYGVAVGEAHPRCTVTPHRCDRACQ